MAQGVRVRGIDKRLLGTWQSDKARTMKEIGPRLRKGSRKARIFASMFRKLRICFLKDRVYSDFGGSLEVTNYRVLASDADSVAVLYRNWFFGKARIQHIHFEGTRYWVSIGPYREFFKRVPNRKKTGANG